MTYLWTLPMLIAWTELTLLNEKLLYANETVLVLSSQLCYARLRQGTSLRPPRTPVTMLRAKRRVQIPLLFACYNRK